MAERIHIASFQKGGKKAFDFDIVLFVLRMF